MMESETDAPEPENETEVVEETDGISPGLVPLRSHPIINVTRGATLNVGGSLSVAEGRLPGASESVYEESQITFDGNTRIHGDLDVTGEITLKLSKKTLMQIVKAVISELKGEDIVDELIEKKIDEIARTMSGDGKRKVELE